MHNEAAGMNGVIQELAWHPSGQILAFPLEIEGVSLFSIGNVHAGSHASVDVRHLALLAQPEQQNTTRCALSVFVMLLHLPFTAARFSPSGTCLVSGGMSGVVHFYQPCL